jgi:Flp pilus assembly protein TadD
MLAASCQHKATNPAPRYTVLRFENLTGDAAFDWTGRAVSEDLARRLQGSMDGPLVGTTTLNRVNVALGAQPLKAPGIAAERLGAPEAGANHTLTGYVARSGNGLLVVAVEEDLITHRIVRSVSGAGAVLVDALSAVARQITSQPHAGLTAKTTALQAYAEGVETPGAEGEALLERAVSEDPSFGAAWAWLVRSKSQRDRAAGILIARTAAEQKVEPVDRAAIDMERAQLEGDRKAQLAALSHFVSLNPDDLVLLRTLAESESIAGEFAKSAADWRKLAAAFPNDPNALNQAGYNYAWSGNAEEAMRALKEYAVHAAPGDANPLDSMGDINYWFGRFGDAAANYSAAHAKDPKLLGGGDLYKAAWAKKRAGDEKAAQALFGQYAELRKDSKDGAFAVIQADWLYRNGQKKEGEAILHEHADPGHAPSERMLAAGELAIWYLVDGKREAAIAELQKLGKVVTPAILMTAFAAQPSASVAQWEARAAALAPSLGGLHDSALAWALILDGKKQAALPYWEKVAAARPATDFFTRDVLMLLKGEPVKTYAPPDVREWNQFAAAMSKL